jgi:hypothetical protein
MSRGSIVQKVQMVKRDLELSPDELKAEKEKATVENKNTTSLVEKTTNPTDLKNTDVASGLTASGLNVETTTSTTSTTTSTTTAAPQPNVLIGQTEILTRDINSSLTVNINPKLDVNSWVMQDNVTMTVLVYDNNIVNNVKSQTLNRSVDAVISKYVKNNKFYISYSNISDLLINEPITPFKSVLILNGQTVMIKFEILAMPNDKSLKDVKQSFDFKFQ